jgi:hypothetical protein
MTPNHSQRLMIAFASAREIGLTTAVPIAGVTAEQGRA